MLTFLHVFLQISTNYFVVPCCSSLVCSPPVTFGSRCLVSLSQNPPLSPPPCVVWTAPCLVSHSQRPLVWYRIARAPPTLWSPLGLLLSLRGVVLSPRTPPTWWSAAGSLSPALWCGVAGCPCRSTRQLPTRTGAVDWRPAWGEGFKGKEYKGRSFFLVNE